MTMLAAVLTAVFAAAPPQTTCITGLEPGDYCVMATSRESWTDEKNPKDKIGFLPTYSGGTASPAKRSA